MKGDERFMVNGTLQVSGMRKSRVIPLDIHENFKFFLE